MESMGWDRPEALQGVRRRDLTRGEKIITSMDEEEHGKV